MGEFKKLQKKVRKAQEKLDKLEDELAEVAEGYGYRNGDWLTSELLDLDIEE